MFSELAQIADIVRSAFDHLAQIAPSPRSASGDTRITSGAQGTHDPQQTSRAEVESSQSPSVQTAEAQAPAVAYGMQPIAGAGMTAKGEFIRGT